MTKPVLITFTSPTCSGKSYLLSYIRDIAKLPCFVSTTTRPPRDGEIEGLDYYFISDDKSKQLEANGEFAELAIFRGFRYGVTKSEFTLKLSKGPAFLIVEPTGIDHYVKPALDMGAKWLKYFIYIKPEVLVERFKKRFQKDVEYALKTQPPEIVLSTVSAYTDRLIHLLGPEASWFESQQWDGILYGHKHPAENLGIIQADILYRLNDDKF